MAAPSIDPERIAQIVVDADLLGVATAAKKHGISERTVLRHRKRAEADAKLSDSVAAKKRPIVASWLDHTEQARQQALRHVLKLLEASDDLHDSVGALKVINDSHIAERVVAHGLRVDGSGASVPDETPAEAHTALERFVTEHQPRGNA